METKNILNGGIEELRQMQSDLKLRDDVKTQIYDTVLKSENVELQLKNAQRDMKEAKEDTINKRYAGVVSSFDKELEEDRSKLRTAISKRKKAKNDGIKDRIAKETLDLKAENKKLKSEVGNEFRTNGVPSWCNTSFYNSMYCTSSLYDWIVFIVTSIICLAVIPGFFDLVLSWFWLWKILLHILIVVIFLAIYITIWLSTKDRFKPIILEMTERRDRIMDNKRQINRIRRSIKKDTDDSMYNLNDFDDEINEINKRIKITEEKKAQAVNEFEHKIKPVIIKDIEDSNSPEIERMQSRLSELTDNRRELEEKQKEIMYKITSSYEAFLESRNVNIESVNMMIEVIESGNASTVSDALNYINNTQEDK